jgi:hypothetical protein
MDESKKFEDEERKNKMHKSCTEIAGVQERVI